MFGLRLNPTVSTVIAALPLAAAIVLTLGFGAYKAAPPVPTLALAKHGNITASLSK